MRFTGRSVRRHAAEVIYIILVDVNASGSFGDTPLPFGAEVNRYAFLIEQAGTTYERLQNRNFYGREC